MKLIGETIAAAIIMGLPLYGPWIYFGITGKLLAF